MATLTHLLYISSLFALVYKVETKGAKQQCDGGSELSVFGMMLKGHMYKKTKAELGHECLFVCRQEVICQSFNFVISEGMCEFNNRTKEARPEDYVPHSDRYYFRRDRNRVPLGSIPEMPAESCSEIKASEGGKAVSGGYWFDSIIPGKTIQLHCDMEAVDIDECNASSLLCDVNANCQNTRGSYFCSCKTGFTGDGKTCNDIDECSASSPVCDVNANCQNNGGSYLCSCKTGYTGDGKSCSDIDECSASSPVCDVNGNCQNNGGSYLCSCKTGYTGDGKSCSDVDECAGNSHGCDVNAACTNTVGSYTCACKPTYTGDGKSCVLILSHRGLGASNIIGSLGSVYQQQLVSYLVPVLQNSSHSSFMRCWRATTDGWAASTFHNKCDGKGPTVTIIKVGSYIFGEYTDLSWSSSCSYALTSKAFIYSLYNINGNAPVKRGINSGHQAIYRCSTYGPTFGDGHDIYISSNAASNQGSYTYCGYAYPLPPGYSSSGRSCTFYAGSYNFSPTDIEVFYETTS